MAEVIADLLDRQAVVEQVLGGSMTKRMCTATLAGDTEPIEACPDDVRNCLPGHRTDRSDQSEEQCPLRTRRHEPR